MVTSGRDRRAERAGSTRKVPTIAAASRLNPAAQNQEPSRPPAAALRESAVRKFPSLYPINECLCRHNGLRYLGRARKFRSAANA